MKKTILIHDTSEIYANLINFEFTELENISFTNSIYNFDPINLNSFSLAIVFINSHEDLIDLAYLYRTKELSFVVGTFSKSFYYKLDYFKDITLFDLNTTKYKLIEILSKHINKPLIKLN